MSGSKVFPEFPRGNGMSSLKGKAVHVDERYLHVELEDGRMISTPMDWYPELKRTSLTQLAQYCFICRGTDIEWTELDYQLSIEAMFSEGRRSKTA
jgi:hypothetical protein